MVDRKTSTTIVIVLVGCVMGALATWAWMDREKIYECFGPGTVQTPFVVSIDITGPSDGGGNG